MFLRIKYKTYLSKDRFQINGHLLKNTRKKIIIYNIHKLIYRSALFRH